MSVQLRYGANPHQRFASANAVDGTQVPLRLVSGAPSYINLLDALGAWQLVRELRASLNLPAATSFKHVSPAGAAVGEDLPSDLIRAYEVEGRDPSQLATAYVRARGADPRSSFGDFVGLSDPVDLSTAEYLKGVVSDGVIAPGFDDGALGILRQKKGGKYVVFEADPAFEPPPRESREVFGVRLTQDRNDARIAPHQLGEVACGELTEAARRDLALGLITLKYTQSNSVGYALGGQMIGIGAGQQSRVDCTKLAGAKADVWHLRRHPKVAALAFAPGVKRQERINLRTRYAEGDLVAAEERALEAALAAPADPFPAEERAAWIGELDGVSLVSDAFLPFRDNVDHAARHGVRFVAQPRGAAREDEVIDACREYGMTVVLTDYRLFCH